MKIALSIFILIFFCLNLLPGVQFLYAPFPKQRLDGMTVVRKRPALTAASFLDGKFQKRFEKWFSQNTGLWGYFVRTENQINYSLFKQISQSYSSAVVLGKDNVLLQREYLNDFNGLTSSADVILERQVQKLAAVQAFFRERGRAFVVLISPSKPALNPEILPDGYRIEGQTGQKRNYNRFVSLLDTHRIAHVDAHRFLKERKEHYPHGAFAKSAAHWNDVATCEVTSKIIELVESQLQKDLTRFSCAPVKVRDIPRPPDRDLAELVNVWTTSDFYAPTPYPVTKNLSGPDVFRPKMMLVGSSFLWSVLRFYDHHKVYRSRDMYYYYRTNHRWPIPGRIKVDREKIDWERQVLSQDVILIEINEAKVEQAGFGFLDDVIAYSKIAQ